MAAPIRQNLRPLFMLTGEAYLSFDNQSVTNKYALDEPYPKHYQASLVDWFGVGMLGWIDWLSSLLVMTEEVNWLSTADVFSRVSRKISTKAKFGNS